MKHNRFLFIVISVLLFQSVYGATPVATIALSNPFVANKLTHYTVVDPALEPYTLQTSKGGVACRQISSGKYAYFNVDDLTIPSTQNNLIFTVTFFDEGTSNFNLQYNANDGNNYKMISFSKSGSNSWITATVAVRNAALNNLQNNKADFRINGSGDNYIKEISIAIGSLDPASEPIPAVTSSSYSEFTGKSVAGYQAWFSTGTSSSGWVHWNATTPPAVGKVNFEVYPDVTEYAASDLTPTALANLGNGETSKLFNSSSRTVIGKHFQWMKEYGIDGAAVQRFIGGIGSSIINAPGSTANKIKQAAEENGRIFYICYDISSSGLTDTWDDIIKFDWVYNVEQNNNLSSSPSYAKVGNKPVVQLWGPGFIDNKRPGTAAETIALIQFLKSRGCYVIGGTPTWWRTGERDSKGPTQPLAINQESFEPVYKTYDMISPWLPGRFYDTVGADLFWQKMIADKTYCDSLNIKYLPVILPGSAWSQWNVGIPNAAPRRAGEFMWHQATNIKRLGVNSMYIAMFDEYDEGTAILKNATDWTMIPTNQYFLTSSADGLWCSSDFQLRVTKAAIEMLKGERQLSTSVPVPHSLGPVYYRNSFEMRTTPYSYIFGVAKEIGTFKIDPCFYNEQQLFLSNVSGASCSMQQTNVKSGLYSVKTTGIATSNNSSSSYHYKIADVKIAVQPNMRLSFWKSTMDDLGRHTFVDIITKNGKNIRDFGYQDSIGNKVDIARGMGIVGAGWQKFSSQLGSGALVGDTIIRIVVGYEGIGAGTFTSYFDDFLIEDAVDPILSGKSLLYSNEKPFILTSGSAKGVFKLKMKAAETYQLQLFDQSGNLLLNKNLTHSEELINLSSFQNGTYVIVVVVANKKFLQKIMKV